jgi:hypothetical protein
VPTLELHGSIIILESLPSRGDLEWDVPTLALHGINGDSAGNYHLMSEESTVARGFRRALPAHIRGIHPRKGILPGE